MLTRRRLVRASAAGALLLSARPRVVRADPPALPDEVARLFREALALGTALRRGAITQEGWQDAMPSLLSALPVDALRRGLDLDRMRARFAPARHGCVVVPLPITAALGGDEGAAIRVFFFEEGRTDPPHVHFNSVTTHLVLEGRFRVRHWDRVREEAHGFVLRATHDRTLGPGGSSSISEVRDNGHWHQCLERGVLVDVEQGRLDPTLPPRNRQMVDLSQEGPGEFHAPSLSRSVALRRYG